MSRENALEVNSDDGSIPRVMRLAMVFIDRIGFPILAYLMMFYLCVVSLQRVSDAITKNTQVLTVLTEKMSMVVTVKAAP